MSMGTKMTMGIIVGNRGFFPGQLAETGREEMIAAVQKAGMDAVVLDPSQSKHGAVETRDEAKRCAELFRHRAGRSTASSSRCRTSGTSVPLQTRSDSPTSTYRCWCRRRLTLRRR